jgi:hypothetical protein
VLVAYGGGRSVLGIARNDDWILLRDALATHSTGTLVLDPWTTAMSIGQVLGAQPVIAVTGGSVTALQILVTVVGSLGLVATYLFCRRLLPVPRAGLVLAMVLLGPLYATLAISFMSDVPTMALMMAALFAGGIALETREVRWAALGLALVAALAAFSIREYAAAVPIALASTAALTHHRRTRRDNRIVLVSVALWVVPAMALLAIRAHITLSTWMGSDTASGPDIGIVERLTLVTRGLATLSFLLAATAPLLLASLLHRAGRGWAIGSAAGALVIAGALWVAPNRIQHLYAPVGNYVRDTASYSADTLPGPSPLLIGGHTWALLVAGTVASLAVGVTALVIHICARGRRWATWDSRRAGSSGVWTLLAVNAGVTYVGLVLAVSFTRGVQPFDRYFLPALPLLAAGLLARIPETPLTRRTIVVVASATVPILLSGLVWVDSTAVTDALKWHTGREVSATGVSAQTVDAGYEWFGWHQPGLPVTGAPFERDIAEDGVNWWVHLFGAAEVCWTVAYAEPASVPPTGAITTHTSTWWGFHTSMVAQPLPQGCTTFRRP